MSRLSGVGSRTRAKSWVFRGNLHKYGLVPEYEDATPVVEVGACGQPTGVDPDAAHGDALRLDAAHFEVHGALPEGGQSGKPTPPGLRVFS